ncbi:MAG TPA: ATP-dependent Clp protease ATP-binding subunit [Candidatus Kapabacteria bacterium]|nr:ATP-dependent Clp protease ATP-binding subunit [Candidatus Kapabacteria bacterium]
MLFTKNPPLNLLVCARCHGTGIANGKSCNECRGLCLGRMDHGIFLYFGEPLTRYSIALRRARRVLNRLRVIGALVFGFGFLGFFAFGVYSRRLLDSLFTTSFWIDGTLLPSLFWLGVISFSYLLYRMVVAQMQEETVEKKAHEWKEQTEEHNTEESDPTLVTWQTVKTLKKKKKKDIADVFAHDAREVLEEAFLLADNTQSTTVLLPHVFRALLTSPKVQMIFIRLGIPVQLLDAKIANMTPTGGNSTGMPLLSDDVYQVIFQAYEEARMNGEELVQVTDILVAVVKQSEAIQEMLYDSAIDEQKLANVVAWARIRERMRREYRKFRQAAAHHNKYGLDRAMTAVATPYLNNFSRDLTMLAASGQLTTCVARDKEIDEVFRSIEGGRQSIVLVGEHGVGRMTMMEGIAERMVEGSVPKRLFDKRLVQLSTSSLLAGTTIAGAQERLIHMIREIKRAGNIILFINNIHDLMTVNNTEGEGLDVSETLAEYLSGGNLVMFATTTTEAYNRHIVNSELGSTFATIKVEEMDQNQAIQVLESRVGIVEYKQQVFFSYDAIAAAVTLASKFLRDLHLPESAIALMTEAGSYARNRKGENQLVTAEDVAAIVGEKTGIPVTSISENESEKLLRLEEEMHTRVIGQDEAVILVANALRRARAEIRSQKKPIATFLFLGATGVGKTELAKTIASVYFGGEERMVRLDMSEYQDKSAVYRLIGQPGMQGTGLLTEAVRQHPFSLVLLDELEKADPDVLNVFLQVFDDGRLTDSVGRVIDFTNTIIIATSNAGTAYVQEQMKAGTVVEDIRQALIRGELKQYYRPEFLNRFDAIVLFKMLTRPDIKHIARLMLDRVAKDLEKRGVELRVEDAALESLADIGFDPEFGARPMRRAIQDSVENQLATLVLSNKLKRRDVIVLGEGLTMTVSS